MLPFSIHFFHFVMKMLCRVHICYKTIITIILLNIAGVRHLLIFNIWISRVDLALLGDVSIRSYFIIFFSTYYLTLNVSFSVEDTNFTCNIYDFLWIFQLTNSATTIQIRPVEFCRKIIFHNWADLIVQLSPMVIINKQEKISPIKKKSKNISLNENLYLIIT